MKYKINTYKTINELKKLCDDGYSIRMLANHFNVTTQCIQNTLDRLSLKTYYQCHTKIDNLQELDICQLYNSGLSSLKIAKQLNVSKTTILNILYKNNINIRDNSECQMTHSLDKNYFKQIDNYEKAYWLGFLAGDGCVYNNKLIINLSIKDIDHLAMFKRHINTTNQIKLINTNKNSFAKAKQYCNLTITNRIFVDYIKQYNIDEYKTFNITLSNKIPYNFLSSYILGFIDADGCFRNNGKNVSLSLVGNLTHLQNIQDILIKNCNLNKTKLINHHTTNNIFYLEYSGNKQLKRIVNFLYKNSNVYLQRKYNKIIHLMDR